MFNISLERVRFIFFKGKELLKVSIFALIISSISLKFIFPGVFFIHHMCKVLFIKIFIIIKHFVSWHPMHIIFSVWFSHFKSVSLKVISYFLSLRNCIIIIFMSLSSYLISGSGIAICCSLLLLYFSLCLGLCLLSFWFDCLFGRGLFFGSLIKEVSIKSPHVFSKFFFQIKKAISKFFQTLIEHMV